MADSSGIALLDGASSLSYQTLDQHSDKLALYLRAQGVSNESPVGVCLERGVEAIVAILGVLKSGGTYVPIDPTYPAPRKAFIVQDSGMKHLLTQSELNLDLSGVQNIYLDQVRGEIESQAGILDNTLHPEDLAYIIYTSGTSGQPKGVMVTHRSLSNMIQDSLERLG
ncbi:MAG: AMP-binding protein, partial [Verrucomicrobiota bacterium]